MLSRITLFVLLLHFSILSRAQPEDPKNLEEAVRFLSSDAPQELKTKLRITTDDSLLFVVPPYSSQINYRVISNWFRPTKDSSAFLKYFLAKNISFHDHQLQITLIAFKRHLMTETYDPDLLFKKYAAIEKKWNTDYAMRYDLDTIQGVYIPKDLTDCIRHFDNKWSDSLKLIVKNKPEQKFVSDAHLAVGMWMRNYWWLWKGSRLSRYFNELGIDHPDDMSSIILTCYHRHLNSREFNITEQVSAHQQFWRVKTSPSPESYPEQARDFNIQSKTFFVNKKNQTDCIQIASKPETDTVWLYNYYKGWVQSTQDELEKIRKKGKTVRLLNRLYKRKKHKM